VSLTRFTPAAEQSASAPHHIATACAAWLDIRQLLSGHLARMNLFPRHLWRCALLLSGTTALLSAQPARSHATPARKEPASAPTAHDAKLPPPGPELQLVAQFDQDGDHRLNLAERQAARAYLAQHPEPVPAQPAMHAVVEESVDLDPVSPGEKITLAQAPSFAGKPLYDQGTLRTLFLEFADADWEAELTDFARTDVLVPARLTVDGQSYADIGVHFQPIAGTTPISTGYKRSLTLALDFTHGEQRLGGERLLQLEDARTDPTLTRSLLYREIARAYLPTPHANFVRLVINGELWGTYISTQPLDETFTREQFGSPNGTRWLASSVGNLAYLGDDPDLYHEHYKLLSPEDPAAWAKLVQLCKTLDQTPLSQLATALEPQLDVERTLRFLALETALMNQGGYTGTSRGYGLYLDPNSRFHLVPQSTETSFRLLPEQEFENGPRRERPRADSAAKKSGTTKSPAPETAAPIASPNGSPSDFPRQSATDLAMLLSYSFINKVDRNEDLKLSKTEWLDFARAWFIVIDDNYAGEVTRDQLTASVRNLITPQSMRNPRAKQTFSGDDAASLIAQDFWNAMDQNHDERVSREEFVATFDAWFTAWSDPKTAQLTQPLLEKSFESLFTRSVFEADQLYIAKRASVAPGASDDREGGKSGFSAGGGLSLLGGAIGGGRGGSGRGSRGDSGGNTRVLVTYYHQLMPLGPLDDPANVLYSKLLAAPSLRARYLSYVREIADHWLNWQRLGPIAKAAQATIAADVKRETHSPTGYIRFVQDLDQDTAASEGRTRDSTVAPNLKTFIEERRVFIQKNTLSND
jgi:hypothetical protein